MNIFTLLSLVSAILAFSIGLLVYYRISRNWLSFIFLLLSLAVTLLNLSQYQMRVATSMQEALLWSKAFGIWALVAGFMVHFTFELNRKKRKRALFYTLIYLPGVVIFYLNFATNLITLDPVEKSWGWAIQYNHGFQHNAVAIYGIVFWLLSLFYVVKYYVDSKGIREKQALLILIGYVFNFVVTLSTDYLFPIFKINFPALGGAADILTIILICYAIWKYQMFSLDKESLSAKLFQSTSNYLLLVDNRKIILEVNQNFLDKLGYSETDIIGKKIDTLLDSEFLKVQNPLVKYIDQNSEFKNKELIFKTNSGTNVSLSFSISFLELEGHFQPGFIYIGVPNQESKNTKYQFEENEKQIEFLAHASLDLIKLKSKEEVYNYIAEKVYNYLDKKAIIGCTELSGLDYNKSWKVTALYGVDDKLQKLASVLGFDVKNLSATVNESFVNQLVEGKLTKLNFNLGDLTDGLISNKMGEKAKSLFGLDELNVIPVQYGSQFYGALHIATKKDTPKINKELIESFMAITSQVLNRLYIEFEIVKSNTLFKAILGNTPIAVFIIDLDGKFIMAEGRRLHRLVSKAGQIIGQSIFEIYADLPDMLEQVNRALKGEIFKEIISLKGILFYNTSFSPFKDEKGNIKGIVCMADDITNQIKSEKKLAALNEMQTKLFSVIGHDLKSPIANILSYSDLVLNDYNSFSSEEIQHFIGNIQKSAHNGYQILGGLLEWSKTIQSTSPVNREYICLKAESMNAIKQVQPLADEKKILISNNLKFSTFILADKYMTVTVLRNLLSNAIKFTKTDGHIELNCKQDQENIYLFISDNGIGMNEDQLKTIFDFKPNKVSRGTEGEVGSGFGLKICKDFVKKNGGRISVQSQPNVGSIFTLSFPLPEEKQLNKIVVNSN